MATALSGCLVGRCDALAPGASTLARTSPNPARSACRSHRGGVVLASAMPSTLQTSESQQAQDSGIASPSQRAGVPAASLAAGGISLDWYTAPSTSAVSGPMVAELLMGYRRVLENAAASGEALAVTGKDTLAGVRAWLTGLHGHSRRGMRCSAGQWHKTEHEVEKCLWDLEQDISKIQESRDRQPGSLPIHLARLHCTEAASLLRLL